MNISSTLIFFFAEASMNCALSCLANSSPSSFVTFLSSSKSVYGAQGQGRG